MDLMLSLNALKRIRPSFRRWWSVR